MKPLRRNRSRGNSMIEFTFVGIPMIFILISTFEAARGMWVYNTLAHAVKEGTRYTVVRGSGFKASCVATSPADPSVCEVTVQKIAQAIQFSGAGLIPTDVINVQIAIDGAAISCGTLASCLTNATVLTDSMTAGSTLSISAQYHFTNAIAMFWPGGGPGINFTPFFNLPASSQDTIQY